MTIHFSGFPFSTVIQKSGTQKPGSPLHPHFISFVGLLETIVPFDAMGARARAVLLMTLGDPLARGCRLSDVLLSRLIRRCTRLEVQFV